MANLRQNADPVPATGPSEGAVSEPVKYDEKAESDAAAKDTYNDLVVAPTKHKVKRGVNDDCAPQPDGFGPKPTPDTVAAFRAYPPFAVSATLVLPWWNSAHDRSPPHKTLRLPTGTPVILSI